MKEIMMILARLIAMILYIGTCTCINKGKIRKSITTLTIQTILATYIFISSCMGKFILGGIIWFFPTLIHWSIWIVVMRAKMIMKREEKETKREQTLNEEGNIVLDAKFREIEGDNIDITWKRYQPPTEIIDAEYKEI